MSREKHPRQTAAAPPPITLTHCNTIVLTPNVPQRMIAPASGRYMINILNLGPGTVYYCFDHDSSVADPLSITVPINFTDNDVHIDGVQGVSVVSDQNTTVAIRGRMI